MKSIIAFICIFYCCQAALPVPTGRKGVEIDGKNETLPEVKGLIPDVTKTDSPVKEKGIPIGPTPSSNITTTTATPSTTTAKPTTTTPTKSTTTTTTTTTPKTPTTKSTTTTEPTTTVTPPSTTNGTTVKPTTSSTSVKPSPSSTEAPITSTTSVPPANRGFDGPSFIGGIVLASGLMAIGFVALKFYRARTELNYHTL